MPNEGNLTGQRCEWDVPGKLKCQEQNSFKRYDGDGRRYCVLHYPGPEKKTEFKRMLKEKIDDGDFNFSGAQFPEKVDEFRRRKISHGADFRYAGFHEKADFLGAEFEGEMSFRHTRFKGNADFSDATFRCGCNFTHAIFGSLADFKRAKFKGKIDFS